MSERADKLARLEDSMNARELLAKASPQPPWDIFQADLKLMNANNVELAVQSVNEREALLDIEEASADLIEVVIAQDKALRDGFWNTNHRVSVAASCMRLEAARVRLDAIRAAGGET